MGFRFRKSMKIAPGVRLNLNKKSVGLSFGKKGLHYSINSSGRKTASVSIPGTGISYTKTMSNSSKTNRQSSQAPLTSDINNNPYKATSSKPAKDTSIPSMVFGILSMITGCCCFGWILGIIGGTLAQISMKKFGRNTYNKIGLITSYMGIILSIVMLVYTISHSPTTPADNQTVKQTTELKTTENPTTEAPTTGEVSTEELTTEAPTTEKVTTEEVTTEEATTEKPTPPEATTEKKAKKKTTETPQEEQVWISRTGSKYHSNSSCSGMKGPSQVPISRAESMGKTPCKKCY